MKLRTKLTLTATIIVIIAVLVSTSLVIEFTKQKEIDEITAVGIADYEVFCRSFIGSGVYSYSNETDQSSWLSYLQYNFYDITGHNEFALLNGDTIISNNTGIDAVKALEAHGAHQTNIEHLETTLHYTTCHISGQDYFIASASFNILKQEYTLSLVRNVTNTMGDINRLGMKCALAGAAVIFAAALIVLLFVRRSLLPVRALEKGAVEISDGNYERRIHIKGHDELASLAERFNRMAAAVSEKIDALGETAQRQQVFINALSHEMKTPVTSIMARAETLLMRDVSEDDMKHSLERIYDQCAWMEKLSGKLTALVLLQGRINVKAESVGELFAAVKETVSDVLDEKNISLGINCKKDTLSIDFDLMRAALVNLVDNAGKASKTGSVIKLHAYDNTLEIEDHGRGIPKEEIARITQPFYMIDRSRSKKTGGSGLGLALVERIVQAHGAELAVSSTIGEGTTVRIIFPGGID